MRSLPATPTVLSTLLLLPVIASALSITCDHVRVDSKSFNLEPLAGPHSVLWIQEEEESTTNTTFTIDVCKPLRRTKGVPKEQECRSGTQVCGIQRIYTPSTAETTIRVIPIAGEYATSTGHSLDPHWTRLKSSASHADSEKEGIRLEMHGGMYPFDASGKGRKQKAVIEFLCEEPAEGDEKNGDDEDEGKGLEFLSYGAVDEVDVLRLEWRTAHACEGKTDDGGNPKNGGRWGWFTWLIIVGFLAIAAYLIFGSWLNYNRYGARGWDLLPHGDTIRDLPYLFRDWMRRVVDTVQSGGSRGGYAAV